MFGVETIRLHIFNDIRKLVQKKMTLKKSLIIVKAKILFKSVHDFILINIMYFA